MAKVVVGGVGVDIIGRDDLHAAISRCVDGGGQAVFAYANIHAINLANADHLFSEFLNNATTVYCDGEGVRLGARMLGRILPPRVVLTYWIWDLCALCEERGFSMFFLGSTPENVELAVQEIRKRHPSLLVAGYHHGYFDKKGGDNETVLKMIRSARPHLLFVGFGMPLQEHWIAENRDRIRANVILPSGSMIDYIAGRKRPAPAWMANHGMEWLFRLLQEPRRLWRRYLLGNVLFFIRVARQLARFGNGS